MIFASSIVAFSIALVLALEAHAERRATARRTASTLEARAALNIERRMRRTARRAGALQ